MKKNIIGVVQARVGSKRLPGKVLKNVGTQPMLEFLLTNLKKAKFLDKLIVATSFKKENCDIIKICKKLKIDFFIGSEKNVLSRFQSISKKYNADLMVRFTADNPLVENTLVDFLLNNYLENYKSYDYVNNIENSGFPFGLFIEIFTSNALKKTVKTRNILDKEHVTRVFRKNPDKFRIATIRIKKKFRYPRLTVDTNNDLIKVNRIVKNLMLKNKSFTYKDLFY